MVRRTFSKEEVLQGVGAMFEEISDRFYPEEWLANHSNIALINHEGDIALFESHGSPGVYHGHYLFHSRGREAITAAREFLAEAITNHPVVRIVGYTPVKKLGAMWLTRHLGFTPIDKINIYGEDTQVWTMHKKDFKWA
jgi:hypothetical protein